MILSLFKGIGNALMHIPEVGPLLSSLLEQYYDELKKSCPKLSNTETQIVCLLLEVCVFCLVLAYGTFILRFGVNLFLFMCRAVLCHLPLVEMIFKIFYWKLCGWDTKMYVLFMSCFVILNLLTSFLGPFSWAAWHWMTLPVWSLVSLSWTNLTINSIWSWRMK